MASTRRGEPSLPSTRIITLVTIGTVDDRADADSISQILASASYDSHIHLLFDDPDGDWCAFQKLHPSLPPSAPNVPPALAQAFKDGEEGFRVPPLMEDETVWSVAWSPCGRYMASGGDLGGVRIWARQ